MALRVKVCRIIDIPPGERRCFRVPGVTIPVMVTHVDGQFVATSSMCPHEDVSLLTGARQGTRVTCPGHGYQFDLVTGACPHDPKLSLTCYRVTVIGDDLYVDLI